LNSEIKNFLEIKKSKSQMPVLFIGHGSPMNAIEKNDFTETLVELGKNLPKPNSILVISAHWCTNGTLINTSPKPKMIYDMYGFPSELYQVKYPAQGSPEIANEVKNKLQSYYAKEDTMWGFDHGNWSIMLHLFPKADIPVFQMSIDYNKPIQYHFNLAKELKNFFLEKYPYLAELEFLLVPLLLPY